MAAAHCPADGGWIGDGGCSHPHHKHSEFLTGMLEQQPKYVTAEDCDKMLSEGFYVQSTDGKRVSFGKALAEHLSRGEKNPADMKNRKERILFAVDAVKTGVRIQNPNKMKGATAWAKPIDDRNGIVVVADSQSRIKHVFTVVPQRNRRIDYTQK